MKRLAALFVFLSGCAAVYAQDLVTKRDGTDIQAIVEEVGPDYVKYRLFEEPDGVTYTVRKSDLLMIRYHSGRKEIFANGNSRADSLSDGEEPAGQIRPGMKYKHLKTLYDAGEYVPEIYDRHSPAWSGIGSLFIPGLGQCINNEWGRGVGQLLCDMFMETCSICGIYSYTNSDALSMGTAIAITALAAVSAVGIRIWSVVDAVQIAKVRNMYEQDLRKQRSMNVSLHPAFRYALSPEGYQPTVGLTLALNF